MTKLLELPFTELVAILGVVGDVDGLPDVDRKNARSIVEAEIVRRLGQISRVQPY